MLFIQTALVFAGIYIALGLLFAGYFVVSLITRLDPAAKGTGPGFRALIFFGAVPFWPLLIIRVWRGVNGPVEGNSHRDAAIDRKND